MIDWETHAQFYIQSNAKVRLQRLTSLGFQLFKIFENFKNYLRVLFIYFLCPYFISGQCSLFISDYRNKEEKVDRKNIQAILFS